MKYRLDDKSLLVVLDKDEEIFDSLYNLIEKLDIKFAWINGIGAAKDIVLGAYPSRTKEYIKKRFEGEFEIASLMGNITTKKGSPFIHIHTTISNEECNAFAGHLFTATVAVTCELILNLSEKPIIRKNSDSIGLYLWDFNCE
tara:strand:+ start:1040 stop:1468 length:429 start_codon:yes stop_codon:yes gene_type:complete